MWLLAAAGNFLQPRRKRNGQPTTIKANYVRVFFVLSPLSFSLSLSLSLLGSVPS